MPVRLSSSRSLNNKAVLLLLILLMGPSAAASEKENCTFIEGHILEYVCHSTYVEQIRLQYKDRIPATGTPYAIWRRTDTINPSYLLIAFYDSPLFSCYTVVLSQGKLYCDGRNFAEPDTEPAQLHCIDFPFTYTEKLYNSCAKVPCPESSPPVSVAIAYMKENVKRTEGAELSRKCSPAVLVLAIVLAILQWRYFGI